MAPLRVRPCCSVYRLCGADSVITAVAFVPSTPMMIPAVASGAAHELDQMRQIAVNAVADVVVGADAVLVVGAGDDSRLINSGVGSMRGFGVPVDVTLGDDAETEIGLAGTIGLWLVQQTQWQGPLAVLEVCGPPGTELQQVVQAPRATALIVVGDGSAARTEKAPGYLHRDAEAFDRDVQAALIAGDPASLAQLEVDRARRVMAAGVDAWHALANALAGSTITAQSFYAEAPYGVGYFIAAWSCS